MHGTRLASLAVAVLMAVGPMGVAAAEGVGFPSGETPKGVSRADGDVCDLDGQRNGVCLFRVSLGAWHRRV